MKITPTRYSKIDLRMRGLNCPFIDDYMDAVCCIAGLNEKFDNTNIQYICECGDYAQSAQTIMKRINGGCDDN